MGTALSRRCPLMSTCTYDRSFGGGAVPHCTHLQRLPRRAHESTRDIAMPYCAPRPPGTGTRFLIINNTIVHRPADTRGRSHSDEVALQNPQDSAGENKGRSRSRTSPSDSLPFSHPHSFSPHARTPSRFSNGQRSPPLPLSPRVSTAASKFACGPEAGAPRDRLSLAGIVPCVLPRHSALRPP